MLFKSTVAVLLAIFFAQTTWAVQLVNLKDEYGAFVAASEGKDAAGIEAEWVKFESRHQDIFDNAVYRKSDTGWEQRLRKKRDTFFSEYKHLTPAMDQMFSDANKIVQDQEARFLTMFPDLMPNIPVIFLPSLFSFNGKVQELADYGRTGLLMGVDFIVKRNDNLNVLFSHEFFHAYHEDHLAMGSTGKTMATPLWKEGFATYVSGALNPSEPDDVLLMDPALAPGCGDSKVVAQWASDYLNVIDTDGSDTYVDWFMLSGPTQPTRRGYCLGLKVIRELTKSHSVMEMVTWDETRFSRETKLILQSMVTP